MRNVNQQHSGEWFFFGTLLSSVGTMTFLVCLVAFMLKAGFSLFQVSLILGLSRLVPIVISLFFGQILDLLSPKPTVICTEILAALMSLGLLKAWSMGLDGYYLLLTFSLAKAAVLALQGGSRARISKSLSDSSYSSNARNAIWLNKVTQGATLFAGCIGIIAVIYLHFEWVILFDMATFLLNGLVLLALPLPRSSSPSKSEKSTLNIFQKFKDLYHYNAKAAVLNLLLAFTSLGSVSYITRLAGDRQEWTPAYQIAYGLSVWIAAYAERIERVKKMHVGLWVGLAVSYALLSFTPGPGGWTIWVLWLIRGIFFWILLHRITAHIQTDTPESVIGSVSAARDTQMITVMALGEVLVGYWQPFVSITQDGAWRGIFCVGVGAALYLLKNQTSVLNGSNESKHEKALL